MSAEHLIAVAARTIRATEYCCLVTLAASGQPLRQRRRRENWRAFFPGGPTGDGYVLIRCALSRLDLMNQVQHVCPEPSGLHHAVIVHNGAEWVVEP